MTKEEIEEGRALIDSCVRDSSGWDSQVKSSYDAEQWLKRHAAELISLAEEARWRSVKDEPPTESDWSVLAYDARVSGFRADVWAWHVIVDSFARTGNPTHWRPLPRFGGE